MLAVEREREQVDLEIMRFEDLIVIDSFAEGYEDVMAGRAYNQNAVDDDEGAWAYERGRLAAVYARSYCDRFPSALDTSRDMARMLTILCIMQHDGLFL